MLFSSLLLATLSQNVQTPSEKAKIGRPWRTTKMLSRKPLRKIWLLPNIRWQEKSSTVSTSHDICCITRLLLFFFCINKDHMDHTCRLHKYHAVLWTTKSTTFFFRASSAFTTLFCRSVTSSFLLHLYFCRSIKIGDW